MAQVPTLLPDYPITKGVSAPFAGFIKNWLIVGGGCNFPTTPAAEGGKKPIIINVMHWIFMPHLLVGKKSLIFPILLLMVAVWKLPKDWSALEE